MLRKTKNINLTPEHIEAIIFYVVLCQEQFSHSKSGKIIVQKTTFSFPFYFFINGVEYLKIQLKSIKIKKHIVKKHF